MSEPADLHHLLSEIVLTEEAIAVLVFNAKGLCLGKKGQIAPDLALFAESLALTLAQQSSVVISASTFKGHPISVRKENDLTLVLIH